MQNTLITYQIKISYIQGLKEIVKDELLAYSDFQIIEEYDEELYVNFAPHFRNLIKLRCVQRVYLVRRGLNLHPVYLSTHKSILGDMIDIVCIHSVNKHNVLVRKNLISSSLLQSDHLSQSENKTITKSTKNYDQKLVNKKQEFKTFSINCAGANSKEITGLKEYVNKQFKLQESDIADLKIQIIKPDSLWEITIQITPVPISVREYKVAHIAGGISPSVANAINRLCELRNVHSYMNVCSGSATFLIEAGLDYDNLTLLGFDIDKKSNSVAIQNITKAGLIRRIQIKTADVCDMPDFGKFDVIVTDLPFGMMVGKETDLTRLYKSFIVYAEKYLNKTGKLYIYTSQHELIKKCIRLSAFEIKKEFELKIVTSINSFVKPLIIICEFK